MTDLDDKYFAALHKIDLDQLSAMLTLLGKISPYMIEHTDEPAIRKFGDEFRDEFDAVIAMGRF
jgi:hypothetical protein